MRCVVLALLVGFPLVALAQPASFGDDEWLDGGADSAGHSAGQRGEPAFESPRAVHVIGARRLRELMPATAAAALREAPGVLMLQADAAGGSPAVRGLLGRRVLVLVDGVRLGSAAIARPGPDPILSTVDPLSLDHVEVTRGSGSVSHGADALGGVVHLMRSKPHLVPGRAWDLGGDALLRLDTADRGLLGRLALEGQLRDAALRVGGTFLRAGDLRGGREVDLQPMTAYWEGDLDGSLAWAPAPGAVVHLGYALVRQHATPPDRATAPGLRRFTDRHRDLVTASYHGEYGWRYLQNVDVLLSYNDYRERRDRFGGDADAMDREQDRAATLGTRLSARSELPYNTLTYGVDLDHDWVQSEAERRGVGSGAVASQPRGRYVDGARLLTLGVHVTDRIAPTDKLAFDLGARVSSTWVAIPEDPAASGTTVSASHTGFVGSLHGRYLVGSGLGLVAGVSQGFRAPNVDDHAGLGCSGRGYDVPNPDLDPEKGVTAEAGLKLDLAGIVKGSIFYGFSYLYDPILRRPAVLAAPGEGPPLSEVLCGVDAAGRPVFAPVERRENARRAMVHAVELDLDVAIGARVALFSWLAWARGDVEATEGAGSEPLSRVPPLSGLAGVRLAIPEAQGFAELALRWAAPQERLAAADLRDRRICPGGATGCDGTPGYAVLTLRVSARLVGPVRGRLSIDNLTNAGYRVHGSGIDATGISAVLGLEVRVP